MKYKHGRLLEKEMILNSIKDAFKMLTPQAQFKNPVMFVTYLGAIVTTLYVFNEMLVK